MQRLVSPLRYLLFFFFLEASSPSPDPTLSPLPTNPVTWVHGGTIQTRGFEKLRCCFLPCKCWLCLFYAAVMALSSRDHILQVSNEVNEMECLKQSYPLNLEPKARGVDIKQISEMSIFQVVKHIRIDSIFTPKMSLSHLKNQNEWLHAFVSCAVGVICSWLPSGTA